MIPRRVVLASPVLALGLRASAGVPTWSDVEREGRGGTVYFNAWGGDDLTNAFIAWAGERMLMMHGITVRHVRLSDTSEAVLRLVGERAARRRMAGCIDLIWLDGPTLLTMKRQKLLCGPVLDRLPNAALIDGVGLQTLAEFGEAGTGFEVPWRIGQVVFVHDRQTTPAPPRSMKAMIAWVKARPGRLTHPVASHLPGAAFLKQALMELALDGEALQRPVTEAAYPNATGPLWAWYDALRPGLWRGGCEFPASGPAQLRLMANGEIDVFISVNPAEAAVGIARGTLPDTAAAYVLDGGTIANRSFIALPFNAANPAAALVLTNFLLSPEAQAHSADPRTLGSPTVLAMDRLTETDRARFVGADQVPGMLSQAEFAHPLAEPHSSWTARLTKDWEQRVTHPPLGSYR